jgi:hypothetical protein
MGRYCAGPISRCLQTESRELADHYAAQTVVLLQGSARSTIHTRESKARDQVLDAAVHIDQEFGGRAMIRIFV